MKIAFNPEEWISAVLLWVISDPLTYRRQVRFGSILLQ